ncbi:hypothetical protein BH09SUM1_BH09SUM1_22420 [soil metagenome]
MAPTQPLSLSRKTDILDPEALPPAPVMAGFYLFCAAVAFVILSLTPLTNNLDDIKIPGLYIGGALSLAAWLALWLWDYVDDPPRIIWIPYIAHIVAYVISTLAAEPVARWVGWQYVCYVTCTFGFVLLGCGVIQTKKMVGLALKFWVMLTFITTAFGLIHYSSLLERFYVFAYGPVANAGREPMSRLQALMLTFVKSREMLSTILNVQFFGNFLLMLFPVTAACAVFVFGNLQRRLADGETVIRPMVWIVIAGLSGVFSVACIFTTFAKSSIFFIPGVMIAFIAGIYFFTNVKRPPYLWLMLILSVLMGATILYFTLGDLRTQLKSVEESMAPRRIIFGGAWGMFKDHPILGMGPGSFRIYFPQYRDPNYHLTRITNVTVYAHNWLLDYLAETGLAGTLTYLAFLGGGAWLGFQALRRCPDMTMRVAVIGGLIGAASLFAGSSTTPMSRWPVGTVALHAMLGTTLGIITLGLRAAAPQAPPRESKMMPLKTGLLIASVAFSVYITVWARSAFLAAYYHNEGLSYSESVPQSALGGNGVSENPDIVAYFSAAVENFQKSLQLDPTRLTTYYKLANSYNRLGDTQKALGAYKDLQKYSPDYSEVHYNLAVIYYNLALEQDDVAKDAKKNKNGETASSARAESLRLFGLCKDEFDISARMSNKVSVWFFRGNSYTLYADHLEAKSAAAKKIYHEAGDIFMRTSTLPVSTVIQEDGQVEREKDQRVRAITFASDAYYRAGEPDLAAQAEEKYLEQVPTSTASVKQASLLWQEAGKPDEALRVIDAALAGNPLDGELQMLRFDALSAADRKDAALEQGKFMLLLNKRLKEKKMALLKDDKATELFGRLEKLSAPEKTGS